ncbi:MAG: outer membrane protein assembly factor BamE [Pseudomonadota bacterium]
MRFTAFLACVLLASSACTFPRLYRATIQQGNVISQEMVDKLEPGMTRNQVAFIMGEPVLRNPFVADRWHYLYRVEVPGRYEEEKRLTLYFEDDLLAYFTGDYAPSAAVPRADPAQADDTAPAGPQG